MKVSFFSNFLNHHQIPLCNELYGILGDGFSFIATEKVHKERLEMGYRDESNSYTYSINTYESPENYEKALKLGYESDVVIIGSAPEVFIRSRLQENRLIFRYSERLFRKGMIRFLDPRVLLDSFFYHSIHRSKNLHMLCASAFTSNDVSKIFAYPNKCWKWGYFTEVFEYEIDKLLAHKSDDLVNILWVGRFLPLKHPELAVKVAREMKARNYNFRLLFIGSGEIKEEIEQMVLELNLQDYVTFLGSMSPEDVRNHMLKADIFLFTSDKQEGWGAVLNESMNSGCAVIASDAIGSVPFLIEDNINGLKFKSGSAFQLFNKVEALYKDPGMRKELGRNAYNTMVEEWNPRIAAERFIHLSKAILEGKDPMYAKGPCSKAPIIKG